MSLVISDDIVKASGFSESELLEIVIMLFQQDKISLGKHGKELIGQGLSMQVEFLAIA